MHVSDFSGDCPSGKFLAIIAACLAISASAARAAPMKATEAPEGHDIQWRHADPGDGGWIQAIAWDPHDPQTLYAGGDVGGFFLSLDGGKTFEVRNHGLRDYFVESIAVHPKNSRVILLGMESGIFRTTDQGRTWQAIRSGFPSLQHWSFSSPIGAVCFDPQRPRVAYAGIGRPRWSKGGQGAIYRSDDAGLTWHNLSAGQLPADAIVSDIHVKPDDSRVVLAATSQGLFRSGDEGQTWKLSGTGLPHLYTEKIAFAISSPETVYLTLRTTARDTQPWNGGVCRSDDAGRNWHPVNGEGLAMRVGKSTESPYMTSSYREIVVDPRKADVVYVGNCDWVSAGVRKTTDGGRTWRPVTRNQGAAQNMDYGWITQFGPAVECMAISPADPDCVAFGTSGHVFATADGGDSWQQRYCREFPDGHFAGNGLEVTCLWNILADPARAERLYFCFYDLGLLISDDRGKTFRRSSRGMKYDGNCFTVVVDPQSPSTFWAATGRWESNAGCLCRSDDDGQSWQVVGSPQSGLPDGQIKYLALDLHSPVGRRRLLATCNGQGVYQSLDGGNTWKAINGNLPADAAPSPRGLLLDGTAPEHMIVALGGTPKKGAAIYDTRDGGKTWQRLNQQPLFADITSLAVDPRNFSRLYLSTHLSYDQAAQRTHPGGVFASDDGGKSWRQILDHEFVSVVAVSPADSQVLYAGTNDHPFHDNAIAEGFLRSGDRGLTWQHENRGLSHRNISCLNTNPYHPRIVYVGTSGNAGFIGVDR